MKNTILAFLIGVVVGVLGLVWFSPDTEIDIRMNSSNARQANPPEQTASYIGGTHLVSSLSIS